MSWQDEYIASIEAPLRAEIERLRAVEQAAIALWDAVKLTSDQHAWLKPLADLRAALEREAMSL